MPPTLDNGYLAVYEREGIGIYGSDGALRCRIAYPPGAEITNVAVDADGTIATAVNYGKEKGSVLLWGTGGSNVGIIHTAEFIPSYVAFAPDHSIWLTGTQARRTGGTRADYFVLHHLSRNGETLGAYLPRSSFRTEREPAEPVTGLTAIRVVNGRVGMFFPGGTRDQRMWLETDLKGKELGRWVVNINGSPAAVTQSGAVYARGMDSLYVLDRAANQWNPVSTAAPGILIGADKASLVFVDRGGPLLHRVPENQ